MITVQSRQARPVGNILRWLVLHLGLANMILLLLILPVTAWLATHQYYLEREQLQQQEQFSAALSDFYSNSEKISKSIADIAATESTHAILVDTLRQMSGNMKLMTEAFSERPSERSRQRYARCLDLQQKQGPQSKH